MKIIKAVAGILFLSLFSSSVSAGTIYTIKSDFDAALAGLGSAWSEDFEGFGAINDPLVIGGGGGEIVAGGISLIMPTTSTGKSWLQNAVSQQNAKIRGVGDTSLGVNALSFNFGNLTRQQINFSTSKENDVSISFGPVSSFNSENFIGWIGDANETLNFVEFLALDGNGVVIEEGVVGPNRGVLVDNIYAYNAVPEPSTFALFGISLFGLVYYKRRRKI